MNRRNYHMTYRKSVYRKKRIKLIAIISAITVVVLLALFLIIGTALNNKTYTYSPDDPADGVPPSQTPSDSLPEANIVQAVALELLTQDSSSLSSRVAALPSGTTAVCVRLNQADGTLLYRSSIASSVSRFKIAENASSAENLFSIIQRRDLYISAAITMTELSESNDILRSVMLSAYASMAAEAALAGANDILLIAPPVRGSLDADDIAELTNELISLAEQIRKLAPNATVGFALNSVFLTAPNSAELIARLAKSFNYFSIDATEYGKEDPIEYLKNQIVDNKENPDLMFYILRYQMRILLPSVADETQEALIQLVESYTDNKNWQILP